MPRNAPETVIAIYRVQAGKEDRFLALLREHYPTLRRLGLVTDEIPIIYRGSEKTRKEPIFFEIFQWKNAEAPGIAHHTPEVAKVWEAMGTLVEERDGKPKFEFPHVEKLDLVFGGA